MKNKVYLVLFSFFIFKIAFAESDSKNWQLKYSISNIESFGEYLPSISLEYKEDYAVIYTKEWPEFEYQYSSNFLEYYKNNYYLILGQGKYKEKILGIDYSFGTTTFGVKINKYKDEDVIFYKLQKDYYLKNDLIISGRLTSVKIEELELSYMAKLRYNFFTYSHYFDLENINKAIVEIDNYNTNNKYRIKISYGREFEIDESGFSISLGMKF